MNTLSRSPEQSVPLARATVADAMTVGVISCPPETPLDGVARLMARHRVHAVYVLDYGAEEDETVDLWGLVSDLDVVAAAEEGTDAPTAGRIAASPLLTVTSEQPLRLAAQRMVENGVSHLAVLDPASKRPVGVLSTLDVVRVVAG